MKKILPLIFCTVLLIESSIAQNVGIGTSTPTEKLHVNGNLNVQGNLKLNGVAGQNGQVLMTNNAGATIWAKASGLKNVKTYIESSSFTIPAGVTELFVEVWSGGGGGAVGGGGGGGGYAAGFFTVGSATTASFTVGSGGLGAASAAASATQGGTSTFSINSQTITIAGGFGATLNYGGNGGRVVGLSSFDFIIADGQSGFASSETYTQRTSTQFITAINYGNGGNAAMAPGSGGNGAFKSFDTNTPATTIKQYESTLSVRPGGGGGGGAYGTFSGSSGNMGMVVISW